MKSDNPAGPVDIDKIKRYKGVFHPHTDRFRGPVYEKHPRIRRYSTAEHEALRLLFGTPRYLDTKFMPPRFGLNGQPVLFECLELLALPKGLQGTQNPYQAKGRREAKCSTGKPGHERCIMVEDCVAGRDYQRASVWGGR